MASQARGLIEPAGEGLHVTYGATSYPAAEVARGAAYELFSEHPADGFLRNPRGPREPGWHRFVHASEVAAVHGAATRRAQPEPGFGGGEHAPNSSVRAQPQPGFGAGEHASSSPEHADEVLDAPLQAPLSRARGWSEVHRSTQMPEPGEEPVVTAIRCTAAIRRGTRMMKILSPRQLAGHLHGWLPYGFCYREYDIAHLRTPGQLRLLRTDNPPPGGEPEVAFVLRWRAIDPFDYAIPFATTHGGLVAMSPHDRVGPPVLGTGFTPSDQHIIPEFGTVDFADLPMTANATLLAYTPEGAEIVLYTYQPEQRGWIRMVGPQWRHLLAGIPDVPPDQEYLPVPPQAQSVRLVGWRRGEEYDAVADPPAEFRVLSMTRAARYGVEALVRRTRYATWRGALCTVLREEAGWLRLRLCRPEPNHTAALGAQCYERGVYEMWAPATEVPDRQTIDIEYALPPA